METKANGTEPHVESQEVQDEDEQEDILLAREVQRQKEEDEERRAEQKRIVEAKQGKLQSVDEPVVPSIHIEEPSTAKPHDEPTTEISPTSKNDTNEDDTQANGSNAAPLDPSSVTSETIKKLSASDKAVLREKALERISKIKERLRNTT